MYLSYSDIAVFVLGTTGYFHGQSSFDSRIVPIQSTWGRHFPYLFYVFGFSAKDYDFLINRKCKAKEYVLDGISTNLSENLQFVECPLTESRNNTIKIIRFLNCSSGYYGDGPTCRCQESLRLYLRLIRMGYAFQYFLFQDDDIYIRQTAFISMLSVVSSNNMKITKPFAAVSAKYPRGLYFSSSWDRDSNRSCGVHQFPIAQPAILSQACVLRMKSLIESGGLHRLRRIWKGTHDHLLGLALWLYDIPVYSLSKSYYSREIYELSQLRSDIIEDTIIFHRMRNWNVTDKKGISKRVIGQVDVHFYYNSMNYYDRFVRRYHKTRRINDALETIEIQTGEIAASKLYMINRTSPTELTNKNSVEKIRNIVESYVDFTINDC